MVHRPSPGRRRRLYLCRERDQRVVRDGLVPGYGAEKGGKSRVSITAAIEAEDELVEIGLEMRAAQAMVDAQSPDVEVGEDALHPGTGLVGAARAAGMRIVVDGGTTGIAGLSAGWRSCLRREVGAQEGVQARGRAVGHSAQADAAEPEILNLDGTGDLKLAMVAASAASPAIVLAAPGDFSLVDLDQAGQEVPVGRRHGVAELRAKEPGCLVGAEGKLALKLQGRNAAGLCSHHKGGPEPGSERQL